MWSDGTKYAHWHSLHQSTITIQIRILDKNCHIGDRFLPSRAFGPFNYWFCWRHPCFTFRESWNSERKGIFCQNLIYRDKGQEKDESWTRLKLKGYRRRKTHKEKRWNPFSARKLVKTRSFLRKMSFFPRNKRNILYICIFRFNM